MPRIKNMGGGGGGCKLIYILSLFWRLFAFLLGEQLKIKFFLGELGA